MDTKKFRIPKFFIGGIFISVFITGCIQPINIGLMESGKNSSIQEFYIDSYKMKVQVLPADDDYKFICSLTIGNINDGMPVKNVKSTLGIKKYPIYPKFHCRHIHDKEYIANRLEPFYDSIKIGYEYKYKFKNKGKYELTIKLTEIDGKELKKDILIFFDQEAR